MGFKLATLNYTDKIGKDFMDKIEKLLNYDALQEMYCVVWYSYFKRFPAPNRCKIDRKVLEHRIDLLRRHR
jgi:hypothetical protein